MIAALTRIPVIGVPIETKKLKGLDSLLSIVQMPKGIPVATVAIGKDGAINAGLLAASILSIFNVKIRKNLIKWRSSQTKSVKKKLSKLIEITPRLETRREMKKRTFSRPRRGREFCKMILFVF